MVIGWALLLAGCSTVTLEGRVVDGLTGEPIAGPYHMKAKAVNTERIAMSCMFFEAPVDKDGAFKLEKLCPGTAYQLETDREDVWLVEVDQVPDGGFGQPTDLTAWRVPKGSGLYKLSGGELTALRTDSDVDSDQILGSKQTVRLPATIPDHVSLIGPKDYLVLVGKGTIEEMQFWPLVESGTRKFGEPSAPYSRPGWWFVGVRFQDDTHFEKVPAVFNAAGVVDKAKGDRQGRLISGSALEAGRYAILKETDRRMYLVDFGAAPPPTQAPAAQP